MSDFEFMNYTPTPGDKYHLGIISIRYLRKIILNYKIVPKKDGSGTFFAVQNYPIEENGEKKYKPAFMLDSRGDEEQCQDFLRTQMKQFSALSASKVQSVGQSNEDLPF